MKPFSCAIAAQQAGEDLIGTAGHFQTYVLIECPMPWLAKAFNSSSIPPALCQYIQAFKAKRSVQFLCINRGVASTSAQTTVLVYEREALAPSFAAKAHKADWFTGQYRGYEYQLDSLEQVVSCLETHWRNQQQPQQSAKLDPAIYQQDILVCTHGMRDQCCARFGQPFLEMQSV
ncbi:MAG: hypothetical protein HC800_17315 [Phormidesmis sp. RL_2_1]|nr:hypothetical protein [Phormidesmis sp. RL_2_1]